MAAPHIHSRAELRRQRRPRQHPAATQLRHWVADPVSWLTHQHGAGARLLGVELAEGATRLGDLPAARQRTVVVLGHEAEGIPTDALELMDAIVEIPMIGTSLSLNVAVAGSLVAYKVAGML